MSVIHHPHPAHALTNPAPFSAHPRHTTSQPSTNYHEAKKHCPYIYLSALQYPPHHIQTHQHPLKSHTSCLHAPSTRKRNTLAPSLSVPTKRSKLTYANTTPFASEETTPSTLHYSTRPPSHRIRSQQPSTDIFRAWRRRISPKTNPKPIRLNNKTQNQTRTTLISNHTRHHHPQRIIKTVLVTDSARHTPVPSRPSPFQSSSCPTHLTPQYAQIDTKQFHHHPSLHHASPYKTYPQLAPYSSPKVIQT
jgi:hypothetical protein